MPWVQWYSLPDWIKVHSETKNSELTATCRTGQGALTQVKINRSGKLYQWPSNQVIEPVRVIREGS